MSTPRRPYAPADVPMPDTTEDTPPRTQTGIGSILLQGFAVLALVAATVWITVDITDDRAEDAILSARTSERAYINRAVSLEGELAAACMDGMGWACNAKVEPVEAIPGQVTVWVDPDREAALFAPAHEQPLSGYDWMAAELLDHAPIGTARLFVATVDGELLGEALRS